MSAEPQLLNEPQPEPWLALDLELEPHSNSGICVPSSPPRTEPERDLNARKPRQQPQQQPRRVVPATPPPEDADERFQYPTDTEADEDAEYEMDTDAPPVPSRRRRVPPPREESEQREVSYAFAPEPEVEELLQPPVVNPHTLGFFFRKAALDYMRQVNHQAAEALGAANRRHTDYVRARDTDADDTEAKRLAAARTLQTYHTHRAHLDYATYVSHLVDGQLAFLERTLETEQQRGVRFDFFQLANKPLSPYPRRGGGKKRKVTEAGARDEAGETMAALRMASLRRLFPECSSEPHES
jgi:hypothetical protein